MAATRNMVEERIKSLAWLAAIERMRRPERHPVRSQPRMFGARGRSGDRDHSTAQLENARIDG